MKKKRSIVYVNYSPYENSGKILDFLFENFEYVFLFSIGFYFLGSTQRQNKLLIYKNGNLIKQRLLYQMPAPPALVFLLLPLRSVLNFLQILFNCVFIKIKYGTIDNYFTVNGFTAWVGNILKKLGLVRRTIYWVWDFYPTKHKNKTVSFMRWLYWQFDKSGIASDKIVFLNQRLIDVWHEKGAISSRTGYLKIPIGTGPVPKLSKRVLSKTRIGFIGVLKKSQGLDMIFDCASDLSKNFPNIKFDIIGYGPDLAYFKRRERKTNLKVTFHGLVEENVFAQILSACTIGIAPYSPEESNVSRYGDPGKIKRYLSFGLPVITTDVFEFASELEKSGAGIIVDYQKPKDLVLAIKKINSNYSFFQKNAIRLNKNFNYKKIYPKMFEV